MILSYLTSLSAILSLSCSIPLWSQVSEETLSGADRNEHVPAQQQHFFGDWDGARTRLLERGVKVNLLYAGDQLWNVRSDKKARLAVWTRVRGTVDMDLARFVKSPETTLHITAVWQAGGNLGTYLGTISSPSGLASQNTFRLDSWWVEKRALHDHLAIRAGQFAGQDSYGNQLFGSSFIFEPFQYALANLGSTYETFDPPSTPAAEARLSVFPHTYIKSMVFAADRSAYSHNPTGLVPQFRGAVMSVSEVGYAPGFKASALQPQDTVEARKGYAGLYRFGASFNPGKFFSATSGSPVSGNYLVYGSANQALYRTAAETDQGLDLAVSADWTPPDRSHIYQALNIGLRFNQPVPIPRHNTIGVAWVHSGISPSFPTSSPFRKTHSAEQALELNFLLDLPRGILLQPVAQYYLHSGGTSQNAFVFGFHTKVDF